MCIERIVIDKIMLAVNVYIYLLEIDLQSRMLKITNVTYCTHIYYFHYQIANLHALFSNYLTTVCNLK